jgi:hypothetical protein
LKHTGTYVFDYAQQDTLYKELHNLALANGAALGVAGPAAPVDVPKPVEAKVLASSKKNKKK